MRQSYNECEICVGQGQHFISVQEIALYTEVDNKTPVYAAPAKTNTN